MLFVTALASLAAARCAYSPLPSGAKEWFQATQCLLKRHSDDFASDSFSIREKTLESNSAQLLMKWERANRSKFDAQRMLPKCHASTAWDRQGSRE